MIKECLENINNRDDRELALATWKWTKRIFYGIVGLTGLFTSFYTVPADSVGVVQRFGAYTRTSGPGLKLKLPFGVESVTKVPVSAVQTQEFGFRTTSRGVVGADEIKKGQIDSSELEQLIEDSGKLPEGNHNQQMEDILRSEYLMLTGDLNMADVEWIVQYDIKNAENYLFNVKQPKELIRDCSLSVMKQLIGNRSVDETITIGREEYAAASKAELQRLLDDCGSGIRVIAVKVQDSLAPENVRDSFNAVSRAMQMKETRANEAMQEYNKQVPKARGEAEKQVEDAMGYAARRINEARGDVLKFDKQYRAYASAPEITRRRMFFEAIKDFFPKVAEIKVIEQRGAEGGILPIYSTESRRVTEEGGKK